MRRVEPVTTGTTVAGATRRGRSTAVVAARVAAQGADPDAAG